VAPEKAARFLTLTAFPGWGGVITSLRIQSFVCVFNRRVDRFKQAGFVVGRALNGDLVVAVVVAPILAWTGEL
jgi:hypothetical protein